METLNIQNVRPAGQSRRPSNIPTILEDDWLTKQEVADLLKLKPTTVDAWTLTRSDFPKPSKLSSRVYRWSKKELYDWIKSRQEAPAS